MNPTKRSEYAGKVLLFLIGVIIVMLISNWVSHRDERSQKVKGAPKAEMSTITDTKVNIISQGYIEKLLNSPSTAKFSKNSYTVKSLGGGSYEVSSYVDSQNGFGAMIRSNYQITLAYSTGDWADLSSWDLQKIVFDGEVIYDIAWATF